MKLQTKRKLIRITKKTKQVLVKGTAVASTSMWSNLKNWKVEYSLFPLSALLVVLIIKFSIYLNNGRAPTENADALVGFSFRLLDIATIIFALSVNKEVLGHWWTKEEIKKQPVLAWPGAVTTIAVFGFLTYLLTR